MTARCMLKNDKARHAPGFALLLQNLKNQAATLSATSLYSSIWSKFM